jgi:ribulose-bisphosphate carboxylase large chain
MAVQLNYIAPKGWQPKNPDKDYVISYIDIELAEGISQERFEDAVASCAAESSVGTWTEVSSGKHSGIKLAKKLKAIAYDLDPETKTFKIAYKKEIFEKGNMSGILASIVGNIEGMKMLRAFRLIDVRFPEDIVKSFSGPQFGIEGVRKSMQIERGPLLCTVPKPKLGRTAKQQAKLAKILFTSASGEFQGIKDDENLTSLYFNTFEDRCKLVHAVRASIEKKSGKKKMYLCNTTHSNLDIMLNRAEMIKSMGGRWMMMDVVTTGFTAVQTVRNHNPGLFIHAHRAMHGLLDRESGSGVYDKGGIFNFSMSMVVIAKIMRLLGVDSLHGGAPLTKMENYGEPKFVQQALQEHITPKTNMTLGQNWFGIKGVFHTASGGLHPGTVGESIKQLGEDLIIQSGGGVLGHPWGIESGVEAMVQARDIAMGRDDLKQWILAHPDSALAKASSHWGFNPTIVY